MRVLVIGAGRTGTKVIKQLKKNPAIEIITADPREHLFAVDEDVIDHVDIREILTPLTLDTILQQSRPDIVLLAMPPEDMGLGKAAGIDILAEALHEEIAALSDVPIIEVSRTAR
jgi:saccharopine dehydrogenase-like NADP-dependent oxidoreductase